MGETGVGGTFVQASGSTTASTFVLWGVSGVEAWLFLCWARIPLVSGVTVAAATAAAVSGVQGERHGFPTLRRTLRLLGVRLAGKRPEDDVLLKRPKVGRRLLAGDGTSVQTGDKAGDNLDPS